MAPRAVLEECLNKKAGPIGSLTKAWKSHWEYGEQLTCSSHGRVMGIRKSKMIVLQGRDNQDWSIPRLGLQNKHFNKVCVWGEGEQGGMQKQVHVSRCPH